MTVLVQAYEDWGVATGTPAHGTNRTLITNANLKTFSDPDQHYFLNDVRRPKLQFGDLLYGASVKRHIYFKLSGTFNKVKNIRIVIPAVTAESFALMYGLTSTYVQPAVTLDSFGKSSGVYAGDLIPLTQEITLYPRLSSTGPESASSRPSSSAGTVYTEYLVLQSLAYTAAFDAIDNYGCDSIEIMFDELE